MLAAFTRRRCFPDGRFSRLRGRWLLLPLLLLAVGCSLGVRHLKNRSQKNLFGNGERRSMLTHTESST